MLNLEKILNKIIKYGLYAILLTPLAFWPKALFPFLTPKFILFQLLVEIVFGAWLILKIIDFRSRIIGFRNQTNVRNRVSNILLALLCFTVISFISAFFGVDFQRSFWGIGARMTGLFAELHFLAWFLVLVGYFKSNKEEWNKYLNFSFVVALIAAATAFYQNPAWGLSLGYGIFNNPTFVAPYLIFHFFWGLYQTFKFNVGNRASNIKLWFFGMGTFFLLFIILFAQIRGAVLGLLIGIFALGIGLILSNIFNRRSRIILASVFIFFAFSFGVFWFGRHSAFVKNVGFLSRLTQISLSETTVQTRLLAWRVALEGFKNNPILGVGPENFNYLFNANYNPRLLEYGIGETWFDKPHNAFLEVLTEVGAIGSLAYVFIWITIGLVLFKLFKKGEKLLSIILSSAFIAYLGTVFFSFDSFGSWFGLYLMLGFLASHNNTNDTNQYANDTNKNQWIKNLFVIFVLIFLFVLEYFNYGIWRANIADAEALRTFPKDTEQGIVLFKKSLDHFTPYKAEYQLDLFMAIGSAIQINYPLSNPEETIKFVLAEADKMVAAHPKDAAYYTNLVKLYDILGEKGRDPQILQMARSYGDKSLALSPNRQETLFYLTKNSLLENDAKSAVAYMIKAVEADSSINSSHWYYGLALIADGQREKGVAEIKKAFELGYKPQNQKEIDFVKSLGL